ERDDEDMRHMLLQSLDTYVHFQLDMTGSIATWEEVHEDLVDLAHSPEEKELEDALAATTALEETERRQALNQVRVVNGVFPLLAWLGEGQPTTPAGGVRRAEIETVAEMIGVAARGTAKLPTQTETLDIVLADDEAKLDHDVIYARSTKDVPQLEAWWHALHAAQIIERDGT